MIARVQKMIEYFPLSSTLLLPAAILTPSAASRQNREEDRSTLDMGMTFSLPIACYAAINGGKLLFQGSMSLDGREMDPPPEPDKSIKPHDLEIKRPGHLRKRSLVEQRWWKLLDFALLRRSSVSFFDIEKQESAVSRWSRAKSRAAKVGKGLSKDERAQKLALQHWLEAIDPRHRYGHNLQFYYDRWLQCESMQPFFYWLDVGEGKEVNLEQHCTRSKLQQQCIKYLGPKEREDYEVIIDNDDGKFLYRQSRQVLDTSDGPKGAKWIFVLSTSKKLYVAQKKKGTFQHSSFLAGGATSAAGQLVVEDGILKAVWPHSGHYRPTEKNFQEFMRFLEENNVDLTDVKRSPSEEDGEQNRLEIGVDSPQASFKQLNIDCSAETSVPSELILPRINSKKVIKSYQLGKKLSCKWTTGAGPRIGCVRDYPSELQFQALEEVNISPRSPRSSRFRSLARLRTDETSSLAEGILDIEKQKL